MGVFKDHLFEHDRITERGIAMEVATLLAKLFGETITVIRERRRGALGTLSWLVGEVGTIVHLADARDFQKIHLLLRFYSRFVNIYLRRLLVDRFRENARTVEGDIAGELSWIAYAYDDIADFFGDISEDFYYQRAKNALVPEYIDETQFPVVAQVLIKSYEESMVHLRRTLLEMLQAVERQLRKQQGLDEIINELWEHLLLLDRESRSLSSA